MAASVTDTRPDLVRVLLMATGPLNGMMIDALPRTANGIMPDIGVTADADANMWVPAMTVLESVILPASLADMLLFSRTAFRCWPITVLGCRALQAWMPSYHEC